jgi:hypothetical protein
MIECVIVLALLTLLVATEPEPGASGYNPVRRSLGAHLAPPTIHPRSP